VLSHCPLSKKTGTFRDRKQNKLFIVYGNDKNRAIEGKWRTPEARLHLFVLLGGFPGAFLAQQFYCHKNKKRSYQIVFWMIVILHLNYPTDKSGGFQLTA
jgi:uncharacterized membrane protein YsdA (DUF1294 family)